MTALLPTPAASSSYLRHVHVRHVPSQLRPNFTPRSFGKAEEFLEALAESDPSRLRTELIQTAAVAVKWVQALDRRHCTTVHHVKHTGGRTEKLVRDNFPDRMRTTGTEPAARTAAPGEFTSLLHVKAYQELGQYIADPSPDTLVELLEVIHTLAHLDGLGPGQLEQLRTDKNADQGGFSKRIVQQQP